MKCITIIALMLFYGCSQRVTNTDTSKFGPVMQKGKVGIVAYNPEGLDPIVEARRESALKRIYQACGNTREYTILKEESRVPSDAEQESLSAFGSSQLRFIEYQCGLEEVH